MAVTHKHTGWPVDCQAGQPGLPCGQPSEGLLIIAHIPGPFGAACGPEALSSWARRSGCSALSGCLPRGAEDKVKLAELQGQRY